MRISFVTVTGALALALLAGCTVHQVEPPSVAGPSTLARAITMTANKDTLFQNGVDFADILVTSTGPTGQPQNIALRAEILVGGVAQDFGTLNTKTLTTPTTLRYTAPNPSPLASGQVAQLVTITVTPVDSGDFRAEVGRQVDLRLVPQGVILPTNPALTAAFTVNPASPQAFSTATFDASTTTNGTTACLSACGYAWNFGDGTSGSGITTTHEYRTVATYQVTLTVTDSRGAQATTVRTVTVAPSTPPTAVFVSSPASPIGIDQDIFFDASTSRPSAGRRITGYQWNFGDRESGSGVTVSKRYRATGTYGVVLTVTDDAGATTQSAAAQIVVNSGAPTASASVKPTSPRAGAEAVVDASLSSAVAGATIVSYAFTFGDQSPPVTTTTPTTTKRWTLAGTYPLTLTVTDNYGRTGTVVISVIVAP